MPVHSGKDKFMLTDAQVAWIAGIIEGEGSIGVYGSE